MKIDWTESLPAEFATDVVAPARISTHAEPSAHAEKGQGYDEWDEHCFYHHAYSLTADQLDDEDNFVESVTYFEKARAWRLKDGRWLSYLYRAGEEGACRQRREQPKYELTPSNPFA
ncbi:MAG TPA: hypothetical protein VMV75_00240 [Sulfuricella sp.]|nr:hypothetical protein [Sulfuricella sp.]